ERGVAQALAGAAHEIDINRFRLAHRLPAELDRPIAGADPAAGDVGRFAAVAAEQDRGVCLNSLMPLAAQQAVDWLAKMLSFEIPKSHIDRRHRGNRDAGAAEIKRAAVHFLPQTFGFERVLANQNLPQSAGDIMAERRIDDRLDDLRRAIGLADPFQAGVGADADQHGVLAAGRFGDDVLDAEDLADDLRDYHGGHSMAAEIGYVAEYCSRRRTPTQAVRSRLGFPTPHTFGPECLHDRSKLGRSRSEER